MVTIKEQKFCDELLADPEFNKTLAYKKAYTSVKNDNVAAAAASRLMNKPEIKEYIDNQLAELHNERTADAQEVLEYLTSVLRGESSSSELVVEGIGDGCSEARTIEKPPSEKERLKAAELLGKRYGIFKENVKLDTEKIVIINNIKE